MANTAAPLSEVAIGNMAAQVLDDVQFNSFDEDTVVTRFMAREYGYVRDELLRAYPWAFAKSRALLAPIGSAPAFGWTYAYQLPDDCLRLIELRNGGYWNAANPPAYELEGRAILCDIAGALPVVYIKKLTTASQFDPLFARALGYKLAVMIAQRVTGKNSYLEKVQALFAEAMQTAVHVDSLERGTPEDQNRTSILDVRGF